MFPAPTLTEVPRSGSYSTSFDVCRLPDHHLQHAADTNGQYKHEIVDDPFPLPSPSLLFTPPQPYAVPPPLSRHKQQQKQQCPHRCMCAFSTDESLPSSHSGQPNHLRGKAAPIVDVFSPYRQRYMASQPQSHAQLTQRCSPLERRTTSEQTSRPCGQATLTFQQVSPETIHVFRELCLSLFPVRYSDQFFLEVQHAGPLALLAYIGSKAVGVLACRIDTWPLPKEMMPDMALQKYILPELQHAGGRCLYIMTLGVLTPYRSRGIGSSLLRYALRFWDRGERLPQFIDAWVETQSDDERKNPPFRDESIAASSQAARKSRPKTILLHVHTENDKAREFYQRHGFIVHPTLVQHYYAKLPGEGNAFLLYHPGHDRFNWMT